MDMDALLAPVKWAFHGGVCFGANGSVLWVDPYQLDDTAPTDTKADVIIVTHAHEDHYSPEDMARISKETTLYYAGEDVATKMREHLPPDRVIKIKPGEGYSPTQGLFFKAVDVDNKNHPKGSGFGVVLGMANRTFYLSSDTDTLDKGVICDVLFCCCDGVYNMPDPLNRVPDELDKMEEKPRVVVPYHFSNGDVANGPALVEKLKELGYESTLLGKG